MNHLKPFSISNFHYLKLLFLMWFAVIVFNPPTADLVTPSGIEGLFWPASSRAKITKVEEINDYKSKIWGSAKKLRPNCRFDHINWYLGERNNNYVPVQIQTGPPYLRPAGNFKFGPWIIDIPNYDVYNNSFADVYHTCYYKGVTMPWYVKSAFWN